MTPDQVETVLKGNNIPFKAKDIQYARQFVFDDEAMLCVYDSGKLVWQGKTTPIKEKVEAVLGEEAPPLGLAQHQTSGSFNAYSNKGN